MTPTNEVVVFLGPSVPPAEARAVFSEAAFREPAARGDVLRAALRGPLAICLIDGYFEHRLAVHHKEILWALSQGIAVYGASSMGALRAAELDRYGMLGHGAIYRSFANGELENDDEVAVAHTPAPDFRPSSVALVNVRATLKLAAASGVIAPEFHERLLLVARSIFYPERSYPALLQAAQAAGLDATACRELSNWLGDSAHRIDQKRLDALELLAQVLQDRRSGSVRAPVTDWEFVGSSAWAMLWNEVRTSL